MDEFNITGISFEVLCNLVSMYVDAHNADNLYDLTGCSRVLSNWIVEHFGYRLNEHGKFETCDFE